MLVIAKNTEKTLLQDLQSNAQTNPFQRCLHLRFSAHDNETGDWLALLTENLHTLFEHEPVQIYLCHDRDIFVLTRSLTQKRLQQFLAHLIPKLKLEPAPTPELAHLFEIGVDWPRLRRLLNHKIDALLIAQHKTQEKTHEHLDAVSRDQALQALDRDLISSLAMRRDMRDPIEIMVVEDDAFSQKLVQGALRSNYNNLTMTADGQGAIMTYVSKAPDVLFLDIGLPDIDGHAVLERIFKIDPGAYVVMFSGNGNKENIMRALQLGAKGFVGKPFTKDKLLQYIERSPFIQAKQKREGNHGNVIH